MSGLNWRDCYQAGAFLGSGVCPKRVKDLESAIALFSFKAGLVYKEPFIFSSALALSLSDVQA